MQLARVGARTEQGRSQNFRVKAEYFVHMRKNDCTRFCKMRECG